MALWVVNGRRSIVHMRPRRAATRSELATIRIELCAVRNAARLVKTQRQAFSPPVDTLIGLPICSSIILNERENTANLDRTSRRDATQRALEGLDD